MSKIRDLINKDIAQNPYLEEEYRKEGIRLDIAVKVMQLRESQHMTQKEFAEKTGKIQSVIVRIENGNSNVTVQTLDELEKKRGKELVIGFK